ncbi:hypothetical protein J19TS2_58050 [Cohnella xylanilytica]|nr:hypothetical protein J19TS2_58050 [Cohnella xylanilytica]
MSEGVGGSEVFSDRGRGRPPTLFGIRRDPAPRKGKTAVRGCPGRIREGRSHAENALIRRRIPCEDEGLGERLCRMSANYPVIRVALAEKNSAPLAAFPPMDLNRWDAPLLCAAFPLIYLSG